MGCCISLEDKQLLNATLKNTKEHSFIGQINKCVIIDCYDGDTCTIAMFISKNQIQNFKCRLQGLDTPEIKSENRKLAEDARNYLISLATETNFKGYNKTKKEIQEYLQNHKKILKIECGGWDKYGRLLGTLYIHDKNINQKLLQEGHAKPYSGGKKE